jgi:hypothetical protein
MVRPNDYGNLASVEARLGGTEDQFTRLFRAARRAFETLARERENGAADVARAESVRTALRSKSAADLAAVLQRENTNVQTK